jgi:hypothetical protein
LSELGIGGGKFELTAKKAAEVEYGIDERPLGGLKKLKLQDVLEIYSLVKWQLAIRFDEIFRSLG